MIAKIIVRINDIDWVVYSQWKIIHIDFFIGYKYCSIEVPGSGPFKGRDESKV
jgi:hypothetical protein